jgi:hypothetical protein
MLVHTKYILHNYLINLHHKRTLGTKIQYMIFNWVMSRIGIAVCFRCVSLDSSTKWNAPETSACFTPYHLKELWSPPSKWLIMWACYSYWKNEALESLFESLILAPSFTKLNENCT